MMRLMDEANRAFADFDSFFGMDDAWAALPASPSMTMRETGDAYELSLAMPGADPDSILVRLDGRLLSISSHQDTQSNDRSSVQHFSSRLLLPGPVEPDTSFDMTHHNDQILIRIPKPSAHPASASSTAPIGGTSSTSSTPPPTHNAPITTHNAQSTTHQSQITKHEAQSTRHQSPPHPQEHP